MKKRIIFLLVLVSELCAHGYLGAMQNRDESQEKLEEIQDFFTDFQRDIEKLISSDDEKSDDGKSSDYKTEPTEDEILEYLEKNAKLDPDLTFLEGISVKPEPDDLNDGLPEDQALQIAIANSLKPVKKQQQEKQIELSEFDRNVFSIFDVILELEDDNEDFFDERGQLKKTLSEELRSIVYLVLKRFYRFYIQESAVRDHFNTACDFMVGKNLKKYLKSIEKQLCDEWVTVQFEDKADRVQLTLGGQRLTHAHNRRSQEVFEKFLKVYNCPCMPKGG